MSDPSSYVLSSLSPNTKGRSVRPAFETRPRWRVWKVRSPILVGFLLRLGDVTRLQVLVDKKRIVITKEVVREILQLNDAEGVICLPNEEIFAGLARMGYEKPSTKLTFYKAFFSPQWKFFIHTFLHSLSAKRTSWNEFSSVMASALICLSSGHMFNFSNYIFESLVRNVDSSSKFYVYPRFIQLIIQTNIADLSKHTTRYISLVLTQKVFANMRRVGKGFSEVETPLFESMLAVKDVAEEAEAHIPAQGDDDQEPAEEEVVLGVVPPTPTPPSPPSPVIPSSPPHQPPCPPQPQDAEGSSLLLQQVLDTCSALALRVEGLENDKAAQQLEIVKPKARVKKLEKINKVKSSKLRWLKKEKDVEVEGRHADKQAEIYNIDFDHSLKVLSITPIPAAKPKILNIAAAPAVSTRRKGVVIRDPKEELTSDTPAETPKEEINKEHEETYKNIDWNAALDHVQSKEPQYIKRYHGIKKKPQTKSKARKNMIFYLKNTKSYKMDFFKGKKYNEILPIFQAKFDANIRFLFKLREEIEKEDEEIIKSINKTPAQKAAKRRKLSEEAQEADYLKKRLEIEQDDDDDVLVEATPLAQKVPIMDYQIVVIDNKPKYKIIRADDTHQFYISFTTLLKNFDKEDLETLWRIVRNRFSTSKPTNFLDEYLLLTLKAVFEEVDGKDAIWRNQKSVHGLELVKRWKLLTSCGVHVITLLTVQLFLLVERSYPLLRLTLEQLVNVARLQVEEESEMSLELLRFTRQQLQEYQQG
nr:hypothetical protein [Tanacetum cinerariifolium]